MSPRDYLLDRFRTDAGVLRERAAALAAGATVPGPDAATSSRMAYACDDVVDMLSAIVSGHDGDSAVEPLAALIPLLEQRARSQLVAPVKAVYAGAATRVREVCDAERRAREEQDG